MLKLVILENAEKVIVQFNSIDKVTIKLRHYFVESN